MIYFTLPIIMFISLLTLRLMHPLSMGLTLLIQTILISITSGLINLTFWSSYILFLIFLGGMLVLFIYISSLASNEKFYMNFSSIISFPLILIITFIIFMIIDPLLLINKLNISISSIFYNMNFDINMKLVSSIYNITSSSFTLFLVMYLLLALIVMVKVMNFSYGPLRQMN